MHKLMCVIPFRKGSKRLPDKSIRMFKGRELYKHTINQALEVFNQEQIIINTDYDLLGIKTYKREEKLCGDKVSSEDVLKCMLDDYPECELLVLLQITSPGRKQQIIKDCIKLAYREKRNVRTEDLQGNPDGQVYVWWTNKDWGDWISIRTEFSPVDINTQLDFEVAEATYDI